jgi:hypothetical protein
MLAQASDRLYITASSSHEPAVTYHCQYHFQFKPESGSDNLSITVGWLEPAVIEIFTVDSLGPQSFLDFLVLNGIEGL